MSPVLDICNLRFSYNDKQRPVLENLSCQIRRGETVFILGPNGTGKTTLLKLLLKLLRPESGDITLAGKPLQSYSEKSLSRAMAYVPQATEIIFPLAAYDLVLTGRFNRQAIGRRPDAAAHRAVRETMARLGIEHLAYRNYNEMSGGERQMVLIARALTQDADILIMDEPTSGLDYRNQVQILKTVADLQTSGYTILMTTHDPVHCLSVPSQVLMLKDERLLAYGPAREIISSEVLTNLYHTDILVKPLSGRPDVKGCRAVF
ncbi:MAG: ABC transporter ATP-binding protein [Eubacteriales bacterium]|nr:ABC transporter ATP-binding protein [Eubacteriales bacterium]